MQNTIENRNKPFIPRKYLFLFNTVVLVMVVRVKKIGDKEYYDRGVKSRITIMYLSSPLHTLSHHSPDPLF